MADRFDTISADDVVTLASTEGTAFPEIRVAIDTGDLQISTLLSARQARLLGESLLAHSRGERMARHTTSCRVEDVNNGAGDQFWVCRPGCPTLRPIGVVPGATGATVDAL